MLRQILPCRLLPMRRVIPVDKSTSVCRIGLYTRLLLPKRTPYVAKMGQWVTSPPVCVAFMDVMVALAKKGGGRLIVPTGRWLTALFNLTNRMTLFLAASIEILEIQLRHQSRNPHQLPDFKVTTPMLKFMSEFVLNKAQRLTFDSSSPNKIILFQEGKDEELELEVFNFIGARGMALSMYNTDESICAIVEASIGGGLGAGEFDIEIS
ncbi:hypothetical protein GUJ93_ZPchr0010g9063 [Zizania palustris]|uniref:Uncharacterized protein n=1 Tax=Zizania palustris TaxID=103762 RepID=A0A8J6BNS4_ZIZPA|nr:hypothetical protein GUJ93_ZPchr0010g9063 [Zizania palustris]